MLKLYENIKHYRKQQGYTQDELARLAGYTDRSSIAKIESGAVDLSQSKILQFAEIFHIPAGDLMGYDQNPEAQAQFEASLLKDEETMAMIRKYLALPEEKRKAVQQMVDVLSAD